MTSLHSNLNTIIAHMGPHEVDCSYIKYGPQDYKVLNDCDCVFGELRKILKQDGGVWKMTEHDPRVDSDGKYDPEAHHPDCAWWKWDHSFSWDSTDCTCDKVGAATAQTAQK